MRSLTGNTIKLIYFVVAYASKYGAKITTSTIMIIHVIVNSTNLLTAWSGKILES